MSRIRPVARRAARRLPVVRAYERRIAELQARQQELEAELARWTTLWPPGHFLSPVPSLEEIRRRAPAIFGRDPTHLPGIELRLDEQWALLDALAPLVREVDFPDHPTDGWRYWFDNPAFAYGDGLFLTLMLRWASPQRLVEVGSGWSSACTLDTVERHLAWRTEVTFVEPHDGLLQSLLAAGDEERVGILRRPVQDAPLDLFTRLGANDVLFIDSTHVAKTGSDVNHLMFEVLPLLAPGVLVHVHDVFPAFEYPQPWVEEGRAWNEQYLLRAFLQFNEAFEIALWPGLLAAVDPGRVLPRFPLFERNQGGSIWLRRVR